MTAGDFWEKTNVGHHGGMKADTSLEFADLEKRSMCETFGWGTR